jgi:hypothetical protein
MPKEEFEYRIGVSSHSPSRLARFLAFRQRHAADKGNRSTKWTAEPKPL